MNCICSKCGTSFSGGAFSEKCLDCLGVKLPVKVQRLGEITGADKTTLHLNDMGSHMFVGWMLGAASHNPKIKKEVEKFLNSHGHFLIKE